MTMKQRLAPGLDYVQSVLKNIHLQMAAQKRKSELLVATEQRLHQQATSNQSNSSYINKEAQRASYSQVLMNNQQQGSSLV